MRQRYVVTYDICDAKRLRTVFETVKGFGEHLQYSVFCCDLSDMGLAALKMELLKVINPKEDHRSRAGGWEGAQGDRNSWRSMVSRRAPSDCGVSGL